MRTCERSVILIDDHRVFREALKSFLETTEFTSVGEIDAGGAAQQVCALSPQIAIVDVRSKGGDAWDVIAAIRRDSPETTVIVLTAYDTDATRTRANDAGAAAYLPKGADGAEVLTCLRSIPHSMSHSRRVA